MKTILLDEKGMTLVELLFATFLMAFVLIALLTLMMGALTSASFAKTQTYATALVNERIESVRGMSYAQIGISGSTDPDVPDGALPSGHTSWSPQGSSQAYEYWYEVIWIDDSADGTGGSDSDGDTHDYKRVTTFVSWEGPSPNGTVKVVTNIRETTPSTDAPTVDFDFPPTPESMAAVSGSSVGLQATASDADGEIVVVRFYAEGHTLSLSNENSSPITKSTAWDTLELDAYGNRIYEDGAREIKVQVWDNAGATSYRVVYLVVDNDAPDFSSADLSGNGSNYNAVALTWDAAADGTDRVEHYFIYRSTDGVTWTKTSVGPSDLDYNPTTGAYTYTHSGLQPWTNYQFYLEARSPLNVENGSGDYVAASDIDTDNTTLIQLAGSWSKVGSNYRNNLSWTSVPAGVTCTGFDIYRDGSLLTSTAGTSYTDTGVERNQTYVYQVKAKNGSSVINTSNNLSLTPGQ